MERRFFAAILLSFVVLYAYQALFAPPPAKSPQTASSSSAATGGEKPVVGEAPASKNVEATAPPIAAAPVEGEEREREIVKYCHSANFSLEKLKEIAGGDACSTSHPPAPKRNP